MMKIWCRTKEGNEENVVQNEENSITNEEEVSEAQPLVNFRLEPSTSNSQPASTSVKKSPIKKSPVKRKLNLRNKTMTPFQCQLLKKMEEEKDDANKQFLLSLLPDYKNLNNMGKLDFKLTVINFFKQHQQAPFSQLSNRGTYSPLHHYSLSAPSSKSPSPNPPRTWHVSTTTSSYSSNFSHACTDSGNDFQYSPSPTNVVSPLDSSFLSPHPNNFHNE